MGVILHIETATDICSVALGENGVLLKEIRANEPRAHISSLSTLLEELIEDDKYSAKLISAFAVSSGPGSYTGLRVGYATAKGLCLALNIPLIEVSTLYSLAHGMNMQINYTPDLIVPMIDARRMEVYTAMYDSMLNEIKSPHPWILNDESVTDLLEKYDRIVFGGDGAHKMKDIVERIDTAGKSIEVRSTQCNSAFLIEPAWKKFGKEDFSDLAYSSPFYLKPANITVPKKRSL